MNVILDVAIRATILLVFGIVVWRMCYRVTAEGRCAWLRALLVGLAVVPVLAFLGPKWSFDIPWAAKPEAILIDATLLQVNAVPDATPEFPWAIVAWVGVAGIAFVPSALGWNVLRRRWRAGKELSPETATELASALKELGVTKRVPVRVGCVSSPLVFGFTKPYMLLPKSFTEWPEPYRRSALLHEAAHIKRFDCAWLAFAAAIRAVYACHPLVWWLSRALRDETELAADERAIRAGVEATDYASALVAIARDLQLNGKLVRSQGVTFMHHRQLENRVRGALAPKRRGFTYLGSLGLFAAALASAVGVSTLRPQMPQADVFVAAEPVKDFVYYSVPVVPTEERNSMVVEPMLNQSDDKLAIAPRAQKPAKAKASKKNNQAPKAPVPARAPKKVSSSFPAAPSHDPVIQPPKGHVSTAWAFPAPKADPSLAPPALAELPGKAPMRPSDPSSVPPPQLDGFWSTDDPVTAGQGLTADEAKRLRELVEKAISEAQRGSKEAKVVAEKFARTLYRTPAEALVTTGRALNYQLALKREGALLNSTTAALANLRAARGEKLAVTPYTRLLSPAIGGTHINTTGISEIVITDEKGKMQVIRIKPGSKKTITLRKGKDGKITVIDN